MPRPDQNNGITDEVKNETTDAWRYPQYATNGEHETFETPRPEPGTWWEGTAASWPHSSLRTTSVEQVRKRAELQEKQQENKLDEFELYDMGAADAMPHPMTFFAGRSYAEGRKLYNEARAKRGLPPIAEGKR